MTPAEFKCLRESMGLSTKWLSVRWDVSEFSVQRWERNRPLPDSLAQDMHMLKLAFEDDVKAMIESGVAAVVVPRVDDPALDHPAPWYRAVAQRAADNCGVGIVYAHEAVPADTTHVNVRE